MEREISSLLLKSNRTLGTRLVEAGLCDLKAIDTANQSFIEKVRSGNISQASLLRILVFENQVINESDYIDYLIEKYQIAAVSLDAYAIDISLGSLADPDIMKATWTIPIDNIENHYFLASAYYLSDIVKKYWEERLESTITWYACTLHDIETHVDKLITTSAEGEA